MRTLEERFFAKVDAAGVCWEWTAARMPNGYGVFNRGRGQGTALAHRVSYELLVGDIPDGLQVDHLCRVRHCVNPDHLEPAPQRTNLIRGHSWSGANARKTRCPSGHEYDSIYKHPGRTPERYCSRCQRRGITQSERQRLGDRRERLSDEQVLEIRRAYAEGGVTHAVLAKCFGVNRAHVGRIIRGQVRKKAS